LTDYILGLFYSDENNLIFDSIKFFEDLSEDKLSQIKMLPYKFLGPVFLTAASGIESWRIDFIESSLSLYRGRAFDADILQSFFNVNSSLEITPGLMTHLFALIGSPHTEDVDLLLEKLTKYIHPSIIQGKLVQEKIQGPNFEFKKFIKPELIRGLNLIDYSLGEARRVYWEEQHKYYCIGLIERVFEGDSKISNFISFDKDNPLRRQILQLIPSFYIFAILPDYYEKLIDETLGAFNKSGIYPNIRKIVISSQDSHAIYMEEFMESDGIKKSYGVILIPESQGVKEVKNISYFKRNIRNILDGHKNFDEFIKLLNPHFTIQKWSTSTDEDLNMLRESFDNPN